MTFTERNIINIPISLQPDGIVVQFWAQIACGLKRILMEVFWLVFSEPLGGESLLLFLALSFCVLVFFVFLKLLGPILLAEWTSKFDDHEVLVVDDLGLNPFLKQVLNVCRVGSLRHLRVKRIKIILLLTSA